MISTPRHATYVLYLEGHCEDMEAITNAAHHFFATVRSVSKGRPRRFTATTTYALDSEQLGRLAEAHLLAEQGFEVEVPRAGFRQGRDLRSTSMLLIDECNVARDLIGPTATGLCERGALHTLLSDAPSGLISEELQSSDKSYEFHVDDDLCEFMHAITDFWTSDLGIILGAETAGFAIQTVEDPIFDDFIRKEFGVQ